MADTFDLIITASASSQTAEFQLLDAHGAQLAYQQTDFQRLSDSHRRGLFDLRNFLRHYIDEGNESAAIAAVGVCIAEEVLGQAIFETLWRPESQRTLRIQLPGATEVDNPLAAALARVPWEIARPAADRPTLGERNLLVRVVHDMQPPASKPLELDAGKPLRVLFVFAEARGSQPLGARQERRELQRMLEQEVYPNHRVVAHFLSHGVTRERLESQIRDQGGYHIVHWSGHGHQNLLELAKASGSSDHISGKQLLEIFNGAGGFLPRLFFLSACHSGDILRVQDWNDFMAVAQGKEPGSKEANAPDAKTKQLDLATQPGFTGTAHALLQGGVPTVVAMRYAVGDAYARELAVAFYRALLAHAQPKNAAAALSLARKALADPEKHRPNHFNPCDHATPLLYGAEQPGLALPPGRSPDLNPRHRRLPPINELAQANHAHFVGRTWELAGLGASFIGASTGGEVKSVAVITGLGGMGKTALVAEALSLWENRFDWVLLYQAKPNALGFEATLRDIHIKLIGELGRYHQGIQSRPAEAIYRDASERFTGPERLERLARNLVSALKDEAILLVLDNFENNLKHPVKQPTGNTGAACQDPAWDNCLGLLASELVGSRSRVLITSRLPLAALPERLAHPVLLGPLPAAEAALYLRAHPALNAMALSANAEDKALALRLLKASRFHPLLMDRLALLAAQPELRAQFLQALERLEKTQNFDQLPALFATQPGDSKEIAYLTDALATSLDQLIEGASPDARRLLWMIAVANEPVALGLLKGVWSAESHEQQQLRQIKQMFDNLPELPPATQAKLKAMPPEIRALLDALPPETATQPGLAPLLRQLVSVGLVTEERSDPADENPELSCHELVRERIRAWMQQQPQDQGEFTENTIRLAYAERLEAAFNNLLHRDMSTALQAGGRALVYCVQAEAWDRLGSFASSLVTSTGDPRLLTGLLPHLQTAAEAAPGGRPRWSCLGFLADALLVSGGPDTSLPFYEQAANQARAAAEGGGEDTRQAWSDFAVITGNWANALGDVGQLVASRRQHIESAKAAKLAGLPAINIISRELEALRIDIMQGKVDAALPEIETRLGQVTQWWQAHRAGQAVPEAPDAESLARAYISALDIAKDAAVAREDWPSALGRLDTILEVERALQRPAENMAGTRMNRASVLMELPGRFGEARAEIEACLPLFQNHLANRAKVLSSLADLFNQQDDFSQAITQERRALALRETLPHPVERASSHINLSNYLERQASPTALAESPLHQLAALIYFLKALHDQHLQTSRNNYATRFRRARAADTELAVPRVAQLLADPAFDPLAQWLRQRQVDLDELQADVDNFLNKARQAAFGTP